MRRLCSFLLALCLAGYATAGSLVCDPHDYGAKGDGHTYDTTAIQKALDACSGDGGTVPFQAGRSYVTGTVIMTGSVHVILPRNATILAGNKRTDYLKHFWEWYIIYMKKCVNCSFTGGGRVDGRANLWVTSIRNKYEKNVINFKDTSCWNPLECRPRLFGVRLSQQVLVEGIELWDPIYWNLHIFQSVQVTIRGLNIWGDPRVPNNDGIDVDSSADVLITHTNVSTLDDAICVKSNDRTRPMQNLLVEDCNVKSLATGLKLGTESTGPYRNITFRRTTILPGTHRGMSLQMRDKGSMKDILFEDITVSAQHYGGDWWGGGEAITLTSIPRNSSMGQVGSIQRVTFRRIRALTEGGIVMVGSPGATISDVSLEDVALTLVRLTGLPGGYRDLRPSTLNCIKNVPDDPVFLDHVANVNVNGLQVTFTSPARPHWGGTLVTAPQFVTGLQIQGLTMDDHSAKAQRAGDAVLVVS